MYTASMDRAPPILAYESPPVPAVARIEALDGAVYVQLPPPAPHLLLIPPALRLGWTAALIVVGMGILMPTGRPAGVGAVVIGLILLTTWIGGLGMFLRLCIQLRLPSTLQIGDGVLCAFTPHAHWEALAEWPLKQVRSIRLIPAGSTTLRLAVERVDGQIVVRQLRTHRTDLAAEAERVLRRAWDEARGAGQTAVEE